MLRCIKSLDFETPESPPTAYVPRDLNLGVVYFIGPVGGPVKIGFTADLRRRIKRLQTGSPVKLEILAALPNAEMVQESVYHWRFKAHRLHGEWFDLVPEIEAEIDRLSAAPHR